MNNRVLYVVFTQAEIDTFQINQHSVKAEGTVVSELKAENAQLREQNEKLGEHNRKIAEMNFAAAEQIRCLERSVEDLKRKIAVQKARDKVVDDFCKLIASHVECEERYEE